MSELRYKAVRSACFQFRFFLCVLLFLLGILPGVIYIIYKNITAHSCTIEFYDDKVISRSGVFNKQENESVFKGVLSVSINKTFFGGIFNYGDVKADLTGKNNMTLTGVKNPDGLKQYLQSRKIEASEIQHIVTN